MRILVLSDTHGDFNRMMKAVTEQPTAEVIIHCGDGEEQVEYLKPTVICITQRWDFTQLCAPHERQKLIFSASVILTLRFLCTRTDFMFLTRAAAADIWQATE